MKNKEKYAKEIFDMALEGERIAMSNETRKLCACRSLVCGECFFDEKNYIKPRDNNCNVNRKHWANSEYVERKEFTEQEKAVIRALDKVKWVARDEGNYLYGYCEKPRKGTQTWRIADPMVCLSAFTSCEFKSIKWEDTEPTSREEILGEEK